MRCRPGGIQGFSGIGYRVYRGYIGYRVEYGYRVWGLGYRVLGVSNLGLRVPGFRVDRIRL